MNCFLLRKNNVLLLLILMCLTGGDIFAQQVFDVTITPVSIAGAPAIHSFAFGQYNGKWIFIGGRRNGLHGFEPPFGFPANGINDSVFVVDPVGNQSWSASAATLPLNIREAVTLSNMEYFQNDTMLYMIGGYGYNSSLSDFITFPHLTAIDIKGLMSAVINNTGINGYFRQITDSNLAVTGGELQKIDSTYYLVFGHKFDGRYDRSDTTGFFIQKYTNEVRTFTIDDDGTNLSISNYASIQDTVNFHRRDFNLLPQIYPNGVYGLCAFSGVFQYGVNLPYLNTVNITAGGCTVNNSFNQNLNQYSTAHMMVFDSTFNTMHSIFFGGISMYYIDSITQLLAMDTLIPFVKTISRVTRDNNGIMTEVKLNAEMPSLLGTNAVFIPDPVIQKSHDIIDLNALSGSTDVGYIMGGISTPDANISETDPALSSASTKIFRVTIVKSTNGIGEVPVTEPVNVIASPNPFKEIIRFEIKTQMPANVLLDLYDVTGEKIKNLFNGCVNKTAFTEWRASGFSPGIYYIEVTEGKYKKLSKIILQK
jgi:hypothetical protein